MKVIFCRNNKIGSLLVRLFTWSRWSHCGVIIDDNVIHADAFSGVIIEPIEQFKKRYTYEIRKMPGDANSALELCGKGYDWGGVFGHWFGAWDAKNKWFCSELVAYCSYVFIRDRKSRVTPEHCYMVSKPLNDKQ